MEHVPATFQHQMGHFWKFDTGFPQLGRNKDTEDSKKARAKNGTLRIMGHMEGDEYKTLLKELATSTEILSLHILSFGQNNVI